jgi:hypothetical protein
MPKRTRMFPGITRQVVLAEETHRLLREVAEHEQKYIGELADELLREALAQRRQRPLLPPARRRRAAQPSRSAVSLSLPVDGMSLSQTPDPGSLRVERLGEHATHHPPATVERLALHAPRVYYKCHCLVCGREWVAGGHDQPQEFVMPRRCNYDDCRAHAWNDPIAAPAARRKRERRRAVS